MPQKTPEEVKDRVVQMREAGRTYKEISKETGLIGPRIAEILRKAGLTNPRNRLGRAAPSGSASAGSAGTSPSTSGPDPRGSPPSPAPPSSPPPGQEPVPQPSTTLQNPPQENSLEDFRVTQSKKTEKTFEFTCDQCGATFVGTEADVPESCPECGN